MKPTAIAAVFVVTVVAGIAPAAVGVAAANASAATSRAQQTAKVTMAGTAKATSPGTQQWVKRYNGTGNGGNIAKSVAVSPDGTMVYVTGYSVGVGNVVVYDYATVAYNAATGAQLWAQRYNGPGNGDDKAFSVAVSPDGRTVYVTGTSLGVDTGPDYATVAYNAATGAQQWVKRYNGPTTGGGDDEALSVAISHTTGTVYVTGYSVATATSGYDYATVAYSATGRQLWVARYNGPLSGADYAHAVAVSGSTVYVTGVSGGSNNAYDYATVAYNATSGHRLWVKRYNGATDGTLGANAVTVSPGGTTVYVTGASYGGSTTRNDYATVAYNAATGAQQWAKRYNGPGNGDDQANSVAVSPNGSTVYVTGYSYGGSTTRNDCATIAYNATTGAQRWIKRYNGPSSFDDQGNSVAVSPDGSTVYVTGFSVGATSGDDYNTIAYNATTGVQQWVKRYNGPAPGGDDEASSLAVSPDGSMVYVTGFSYGKGYDYATVAYQG